MEEARRLYPQFDVTRSWDLPQVPVLPADETLESYLKRLGFTEEQLQYTRRSFGNAQGDSIHYISAQAAMAEIEDVECGEGDFRIMDGYGSLAEYLATGLDIRLNTIVTQVEWIGAGVRVHTQVSQFEADQVIIAVPLGVLQAQKISFTPALPVEKLAAIRDLRMGPVIKLVYRFAEPILPGNIMALYSAGVPPMWWSPSFGQDTNKTVWTAFVSGDWARELLALGETGALEKALDTLRGELNRPDLKPLDCCLVNWPADPFALGGYSVAAPGRTGARAELARPLENKLFWAGEASASLAHAATVHGAYLTGQRAAKEVLKKQVATS
jgi:monoamine oxidase